MNSKLLELKNLSIGYPNTPLFHSIDLSIGVGDVICIMGENGVGKSTFLKTLSTEVEPLQGNIYWRGEDFLRLSSRERAQRMSLVLSRHQISFGVRVNQILELSLTPKLSSFWRPSPKEKASLERVIEEFEIRHLLERRFDELSDGQKQIVMVARAVAQDPELILLDEPTNFLDLTHQISTLLKLKEWAANFEKTLLFTSHHWELILELATEVWLFDSETKRVRRTSPEDLILSNEIQKLMGLDVASFDRDHGRFKLAACHMNPLKLEIEDNLKRSWAEHFFSKHGIYSGDSKVKVKALASGEWELSDTQNRVSSYSSLNELIYPLKSALGEA